MSKCKLPNTAILFCQESLETQLYWWCLNQKEPGRLYVIKQTKVSLSHIAV